MIELETTFNNILSESFKKLILIEDSFYKKGEIIATKLDEFGKSFKTDLVIMLTDYNTLVCSKLLYNFIRKLLYGNNLTHSEYRGHLHSLLEYSSSINILNKLSPELWDNYVISNSGVTLELKRFTKEVNDSIIEKIMEDHSITKILIGTTNTKISELSIILMSQLNMLRIISTNATIEGIQSEFHSVIKSYLDWIIRISESIKIY